MNDNERQENDSMSAWITVRQAAEILNLTVQGVSYLLREKHLEGTKLANIWIVRRESVEAYKTKRDKPQA